MSSLLRSTKFVRYFAGAARTLILNSAKTTEANLLANSKVTCTANNLLLRDYATTKKAESIEPLLQKLDAEVRKYGRITKKDIDEVFNEIRTKHDITSSQSLLIIGCCGELVPEELPERRTMLVQKIWSVLTDIGVPMDISHYNALLKVYIENEHPFSPAAFLEELEKKGLQPNRVTYQRLMWRYCQEGDVEGATRVLEKMREVGLPVSEPVLNALVMGHAFQGDTDRAKAVLETMAGAGLQPSNRTYALLACGYAKKGDLDGIQATLSTANEKDAFMTDKDILDIIESLALAGHGDKVESLFKHLVKGPSYNQDVCNLIIRLINKGELEIAKVMMKTMLKTEKFEDTLYKGAFFIKQLLKTNKSPDDIIKKCNELKDENLVPNAIYIATEGALQHGFVELAQKLLKELHKSGMEIRQHYYWPLLVAKGKENDEEGIIQIVKEMTNQGLFPSTETLKDYIFPYLKRNDNVQNIITKLQIANVPVFHCARSLMVDLLESGKITEAADIAVQYRPFGQHSYVGRPLVNALTKTKDINSFVSILHVISSRPNITDEEPASEETNVKEDYQSIHEISRIVLTAVKNLPKTHCQELLEALYSKGIKINTATAEKIEQHLAEAMTSTISEKLAQLSSPELEFVPLESPKRNVNNPRNSTQLEKILAQAKAKGANVNRLQKQLLLAYINENNIDKVNNYVKELESENFDLTSSTLAQLFEFYALNNEIGKALEIKDTLEKKDPDFLLNGYKLITLAHSLVKANRFDDAVEFLEKNKPNSIEEQSFILGSKAFQLVNSLAEAKEVDKVKKMTQVLIDNKFVEPSNIILGPLIKVHLLNDDIDSAIKEFEHCCKEYRSTPWKGEIMKALIVKEDATKLQWLADLSTQIHGEVNILHDLVLAFVECGRLRQARRILETPGLHTKHKRLLDACQRYVEEGKTEYLEGLLEATKELSHIDRSKIFFHLLLTYCKADETDKALNLWTVLQEDGEIPSTEFLQYLGRHLRSKGREVPFVIPSENQSTKPDKSTQPKTEKQQSKKENTRENTSSQSGAVTKQIEKLIQEGKLTEALNLTIEHTSKPGQLPKYNVVKYLLRNLAEQGEVEQIKALGERLDNAGKRKVTYDDKLTLAIFVKGAATQHIDELYASVTAAKTDEDLDRALVTFPSSKALASILENEDLVTKCHKIAEHAAEKGKYFPANLLWTEYLLSGKEKEADELWKQHLIKTKGILYRRLLQELHIRNQPQTIEKVITYLKTNKNITEVTLGNIYSRLINLHLAHDNVEAAKATLDKALSEGLKHENFAKNTLKMLNTAAG